ncbi:TcfC E-set like domain-containing protein [Tsuneonella sp. SYSU-LHT278]|uniref:TcfC E-set like domain-containing protein n=1 Tax=Tsuneonella sediminis TaxID=3416089 RepID=UPI003F7AB6B4
MSEPAGFSRLDGESLFVVDVFFGGVRVGEARIMASPETIRFEEPDQVRSLLPPAVDPGRLLAALARPSLDANADLACVGTADPARCGRLEPLDVGVILNREKFRLDIFLNPELLRTEPRLAEEYLPEAQHGWSLVNSIGGIVAGQFETGGLYVNVQDQFVLARGSQRLRADLAIDSERGFRAEQLLLEWDRPERRYSAGALWTRGDDLYGRTKLLGLGLESQIDTRRDRDELEGTPVVVFLDRRSRVDIEYRGRVVSSRIYEAGNRQLDTSSLPDGSYEITLRIVPNGGAPREEARFYSKSPRLPSLGRTDFYAFGGVIIDDHVAGSGDLTSAPLAEGGVIHRVSDNWALEARTRLTEDDQSAQVGVTYLSPMVKVRAAGIVGSDGTRGTLLNLSSTGTGRLHFSIDVRDVHSGSEEPPPGALSPGQSGPLSTALPSLSAADSRYTQIGGLAAFSAANVRFLSTMFYRDARGEDAQFGIGPALEWDAYRSGPLVLTLRGDLTVTETGRTGFAGMSLRFVGRKASATALAGVRSSTTAGDSRGSGFSGALSAGWNARAIGGDMSVGLGYEHDPEESNVFASAQVENSAGSLSADLARTSAGGNFGAATQYALGFRSTIVASQGQAPRIVGKTTTESMIVAKVAGAGRDDRFQVLVDEQVAATIEGDRSAFISLPSYRAYQVRVRPAGKRLLSYDSSSHEVSLLPGSVVQLAWDTAPVVIKVGQLVDSKGVPVANASIAGPRIWSQTDDLGFFQVEAPEGTVMEVTTADGRRFPLTLPSASASLAGLVHLDRVRCCDGVEGREMARNETSEASRGIGK